MIPGVPPKIIGPSCIKDIAFANFPTLKVLTAGGSFSSNRHRSGECKEEKVGRAHCCAAGLVHVFDLLSISAVGVGAHIYVNSALSMCMRWQV